MKQRTT
jgi:hypothetical protein